MTDPSLFILYVDNPPLSTRFYRDLLDKTPVEASPGFAMFVLDSGMKFGLWLRHAVEPAIGTNCFGGELAFAVADRAAVDTLYADWRTRGLTIAQTPTPMDFGYTFVALDPDGNRLRVYSPAD
jgi:catechol 2,3-dioxygenase-like lactoylglutathione lyase family enzyme